MNQEFIDALNEIEKEKGISKSKVNIVNLFCEKVFE